MNVQCVLLSDDDSRDVEFTLAEFEQAAVDQPPAVSGIEEA
jgi:hypothetical protein